jgi:hypothetical protein
VLNINIIKEKKYNMTKKILIEVLLLLIVIAGIAYGATGSVPTFENTVNWNTFINLTLISIAGYFMKRSLDDIKAQSFLAKEEALKCSEDAKQLALKVSDEAKSTALRVTSDTKETALRVSTEAKETSLRVSTEAKEIALQVGKDLGDKMESVSRTHLEIVSRLAAVEASQLLIIKKVFNGKYKNGNGNGKKK